jgi:hypothetical protein
MADTDVLRDWKVVARFAGESHDPCDKVSVVVEDLSPEAAAFHAAIRMIELTREFELEFEAAYVVERPEESL